MKLRCKNSNIHAMILKCFKLCLVFWFTLFNWKLFNNSQMVHHSPFDYYQFIAIHWMLATNLLARMKIKLIYIFLVNYCQDSQSTAFNKWVDFIESHSIINQYRKAIYLSIIEFNWQKKSIKIVKYMVELVEKIQLNWFLHLIRSVNINSIKTFWKWYTL